MKKILVTTLALSLAVISSLDALPMMRRQRGRSMSAPVRVTPADLNQAAKAVIDAKKDGSGADIKVAAQDVVAVLTDPNQTPEQAELVAKRTEAAELEKDMKLKKFEMDDMNLGWFGFSTTKEQKEAYAKAKGEYNEFNAKLKTVNSRIRELQIATGKAWSNAVRLGIGALAAVGVSLAGYFIDQRYNEGKGSAAIRQGLSDASEGVVNKWNQFRGNKKPLVVTPASAADMG